MNTKQVKKSTTKKNTAKRNAAKKGVTNPELSEATREALENGIRKPIALELVDDNPKNRKYYKQSDLEAFAQVLKTRGQIHEVIVVENGERFRLIAGHRRVKSLRIASLPTVRANIVKVTEAQEKEIMFSENKDRVDPHPLDDAALIASMQDDNFSMEEISLRLVKPLSFVYNRIKLNSLIAPFREMFVEERMNIKEALQLATLSEESQERFFNDHCTEWKEDEHFVLDDIEDVLSNYIYDLQKAPFDTKAENLIPGKGACTTCKFNSATAAVLFPEMAEQSICSDFNCYGRKCSAHYHLKVVEAVLNDTPEAIIFTSYFSEDVKSLIRSLPETTNLPSVDWYQVNTITAPEAPKKETYSELNEEGGVEFFDEKEYNLACTEYEADKQEFELMIHSGEVQKGLFIGQKEIKVSYFRKSQRGTKPNIPQQTKKQVDEAIKTKTATAKLLEDEMLRMEEKKKQSERLKKEKIQMTIHKEFTDVLKKPFTGKGIVDADIVATRVIIYHSMDWNASDEVNKILGIDKESDFEKRYEVLSQLSEEQTAYLIRKALQSKSDSKYPKNLVGHCLYQLAENWDVNKQEIEEKQSRHTEEEIKGYDSRIKEMKERLETMKIAAE